MLAGYRELRHLLLKTIICRKKCFFLLEAVLLIENLIFSTKSDCLFVTCILVDVKLINEILSVSYFTLDLS